MDRLRSEGWLQDLRTERLFQQFPLALAVLSPSGSVEMLNRKFAETYEPACLGSPVLQGMVGAPATAWQHVTLTKRDATEVSARAQCLPLDDGVVIVVDPTAEEGGSNEVELLHLRVLELERQSSTDRLTGAWNRLHLDRVIAAEIDRSAKLKEPLSIVLVDIDHFKSVNDTHGHLAGDEVLKHLVSLVRAHTRGSDLLFRWGGEEFVLLAAAGYRAAERIADGLRRIVEQATFPTVGRVTISVGVAEHLPSESTEAWFARADTQLYAAKNGGRNRVAIDRRGSSDVWGTQHGPSALHLVWLEAYESGEATIDREHRELFDLANDLIDVSVDPRDNTATQLEAMDRLIAHVATHFADEEALLEKHGYAHLAAHKNTHARLVERATRLRDDMAAGKTRLGDVVDFLAGEVVARHMFTTDRDFFPLFRA